MVEPIRALLVEMADALDHDRQCLMDDRRLTHPLADRARAVLAAAQGETGADGPAVPEGREPASVAEQPSDEELLKLMPESMREEFSHAAQSSSALTGGKVRPGIFRVCLNTAALEYARAVLARWGRPAQPAPPVEGLTFSDAIQLAQGCHDYSGGHSGFMAEAFHGGIDTVISVLRKAAAGSWDFQTQAVFAAGAAPESAPPAEGETAELSPKEIEARDAFTAMRDEILHGLDGFDPDQTNAVLDVIDNHTPEWV